MTSIADRSQAYDTPCEIQSVVIAASFAASVMTAVLVVVAVVVLI